MDGFKEFLTGLLEQLRRLVVADAASESIQCCKTDTGFQILFCPSNRLELFTGRLQIGIGASLALFDLGVHGVVVINPFKLFLVTSMHAIYVDITRITIGPGFAPTTDF